MTLATKNGSVIVKNGSIAENCGCCGDWYCCASSACATDVLSSVSVTITAQDYLRHRRVLHRDTDVVLYESLGFGGSSISGVYSLVKTTASGTGEIEWVAPNGSNAFRSSIKLNCCGVSGSTLRWRLYVGVSSCVYATSVNDYKSLSYLGGIFGITFSPSPYMPVLSSTFARQAGTEGFFSNTVDQCGTFAPLNNSTGGVPEATVIYNQGETSRGTQVIGIDFLTGSPEYSVSVSFS